MEENSRGEYDPGPGAAMDDSPCRLRFALLSGTAGAGVELFGAAAGGSMAARPGWSDKEIAELLAGHETEIIQCQIIPAADTDLTKVAAANIADLIDQLAAVGAVDGIDDLIDHIEGWVRDAGAGYIPLREEKPVKRVVPDFPASTYAFLTR